MKKRITLLLSLVLVLTLGFTSCNDNQAKKDDTKEPEKKQEQEKEDDKKEENKDTKNEEEKELKPIKIVLDWIPNTNHTGLYCAKEMGLFEKAGFDVEIMQPPEGSTTLLIGSGGGELGIAFQDFLAANFASKTPIPVTAVAAILQHNTSGIISTKESGIASPKDLSGTKYATWDLDIEKAIIKKMMENEGANFDDLELVPSTWSAVTDIKEAADSAWVFYAWDGIKLELENIETNFIAVKDFLPFADYYTPVIIANNEWLENNPKDAKKIMAAISEGYEFAANNPEKAAEYLLKNAPELSSDLALASQKWISKEYIADAKQFGYIDPQRWDAFYAWLFEAGLIEQEIPAGFGFSNEYLPEK